MIDSHCHLDLPVFDPDRDAILRRCHGVGVSNIIVPAITAARWPALQLLCDKHAGLHAALGLHPMFIHQHRPEHLDQLDAAIDRVRPLAVGEIGLDFYRRDSDRQQQLGLFEAQLAIAARHQLPVLLHVRKAHDEVLVLLQRYSGRGLNAGGIAHAFNGSLQQGRHYIELGFRLGFGGMLTFERSSKLRALARALPIEALVLETDAPDMTVASHRGERNSPEFLPEIAEVLASLRATDVAEIAARTSENCQRLFYPLR